MKKYTEQKLYQCLKEQAKRSPKLMFFFFHVISFRASFTIE